MAIYPKIALLMSPTEEFSSCVAPPNIAHGFMYDSASSYPLESKVSQAVVQFLFFIDGNVGDIL